MEEFKFDEPAQEKVEEKISEMEKDWFEKQWQNPEHIKVIGSDENGLKSEFFDVYDITPEGEAKSLEPIVIGMGWGAIPESDKKGIKYWAEHGRRVIVPDTPHGISAENKNGFAKVEIEKMTALIETLRAKGIEIKEDGTASGKINLMGRSEGAIFSVLLAYLYPQLVKDLVLENPAGLTGKINPGIFAMRWFRLMKQQIMKEYKETGVNPGDHMPEVFARNPAKMIESVMAISTGDVREMLKEIRENGIGVSVIATTDDKFFPIDKLAGTVETDKQTGEENVVPELTADDVDGFYSLQGSHTSYFYEPEKFAMVVDQAFDALDAKRKTREKNREEKLNKQTEMSENAPN